MADNGGLEQTDQGDKGQNGYVAVERTNTEEKTMTEYKTDLLDLRRMDCMDLMAQYPDKHFKLAIVDPPYGIGRDGGETGKNWKVYQSKEWDKEPPKPEYWKELFRVSQNQIVWGRIISQITCHLQWDGCFGTKGKT
jgi:hypothetical protein